MTDLGSGARLLHIEDADDERLADYLHLTDVALRRKLEPAGGLYMAESSNVIARAVAAGHRPRSFLMAPRWLESMAPVIAEAMAGATGAEPVPVFLAEEPLLREITGFHLHRGALAAMHRPELPTVEEILAAPAREAGRRRLVVLEDIVDHTNVGAMSPSGVQSQRRIAVFEGLVDHTNLGAAFRSAAALGIDGILVTPDCADPLYRRSVRVSMGGVFQVPWTRIEWPAGIDRIHRAGYATAALALSDDSITLDELAAANHDRLAVIFGGEGHGLRPSTLRRVQHVARIPMANGVDSLNVAAAAAVTFYALRA